ncbi:hypothetical protein GCM10007979_34880 [Nocardioides albus]|nr:DUF4241 domain-containing protein [Nocardioides albus]GGU32947.1 hypothetical protein GCM10007979_34880 [Nocardioides albus]
MHEFTYAGGWRNGLVDRLSPDQARARDERGEPYVVVIHDGGSAVAVVGVAREDHRFEIERFDESGRRVALARLSDPGAGFVVLQSLTTWDFTQTDDVREAGCQQVKYRSDGICTTIEEPQGERGGSVRSVGLCEERPQVPTPVFGEWSDLLRFVQISTELSSSAGAALAVVRAEPWEPSPPLRAGDVVERFRVGSVQSYRGTKVQIREVTIGSVAITEGRVMAADPGWIPSGEDAGGFTATIPSGIYPVTLSLAATEEEAAKGWGMVAAATLRVADRRVISWEMGLTPGQDQLDLGADEFYGMGVDTGTGAFLDAARADELTDVYDDGGWKLLEDSESSGATLADGAMVAYASGEGDGAYPVWIGRDEAGDVVCFVADMLLLDDR